MTKVKILTGVALSSLMIAGSGSVAAEQSDQWYISPMLSYIGADSDRSADDDFGLHLGVGKYLSEKWNVELSLVTDTLDFESTSGEYKQTGLVADGLYFFQRDADMSVYGVVGLGALRTKVPGDSASNLAANVGVGMIKPINDSFDFRGDIRYRLDDDDRVAGESRFGDWLINLGLLFPFGGETKAQPMAAAEPAPEPMPMAPIDSDSDGVADESDKCPNTTAGAKVDGSGCELDSDKDGVVDSQDRCPTTAPGRTVMSNGCEKDSDNDGVVDAEDRCPSTVAGAAVNDSGCEVDGDNDGIVDRLDSCPNSAAGAKVDGKGCELAEVIVLKGVNFESGSARLTADSQGELNELVQTMNKYPSLVIEVAGHTDNSGSVAFNTRLSGQRAAAVVDYLAEKGIDAARLQAKGYGPDQPIADNATAEGRAKNRRVELHILKR